MMVERVRAKVLKNHTRPTTLRLGYSFQKHSV